MKIIISLLVLLFLISFSSAQLGYSDPSKPKLEAPQTNSDYPDGYDSSTFQKIADNNTITGSDNYGDYRMNSNGFNVYSNDEASYFNILNYLETMFDRNMTIGERFNLYNLIFNANYLYLSPNFKTYFTKNLESINGANISTNYITANNICYANGTNCPTSSININNSNFENLSIKNLNLSGIVRGVTINGNCTNTSATVEKVVTIPNYTPNNGDLLAITFTQGSAVNNPSLKINGFTSRPITLGLTNASTTTFTVGANTTVLMYYDGLRYQLTGSYRLTDTDTDNYDRIRYTSGVQVGNITYQYKFGSMGTDGKFYPFTIENTNTVFTKNVSQIVFRLGADILNYGTTTTLNPNANSTVFYSSVPTAQMAYTFNQNGGYTWLTNLYIVGIPLGNGTYRLDNSTFTSWYNQTLPTTEDGKIYIRIGYVYNTNSFYLAQNKPIYEFKNGALRLYQVDSSINYTNIIMSNITTRQNIPNINSSSATFYGNIDIFNSNLLNLYGNNPGFYLNESDCPFGICVNTFFLMDGNRFQIQQRNSAGVYQWTVFDYNMRAPPTTIGNDYVGRVGIGGMSTSNYKGILNINSSRSYGGQLYFENSTLATTRYAGMLERVDDNLIYTQNDKNYTKIVMMRNVTSAIYTYPCNIGNEAQLGYNYTSHKAMYCNSTNWVEM